MGARWLAMFRTGRCFCGEVSFLLPTPRNDKAVFAILDMLTPVGVALNNNFVTASLLLETR